MNEPTAHVRADTPARAPRLAVFTAPVFPSVRRRIWTSSFRIRRRSMTRVSSTTGSIVVSPSCRTGGGMASTWRPIGLRSICTPFVVQRFIDESLVLARYGADPHHIARDRQFWYGEIFRVERDMGFPWRR
jgi:hypothetical protein